MEVKWFTYHVDARCSQLSMIDSLLRITIMYVIYCTPFSEHIIISQYMYSAILLPVGIIVKLVIIAELDIVVKELCIVDVAVVIIVNMGTGDPNIGVVTETVLLFVPSPQLFLVVIVT